MRCSITLTIISAVTLTAAQSRIYTKDPTQHSSNKGQLQSRDSDHLYTLEPRSPVPGLGHSKPKVKPAPKAQTITQHGGLVANFPFRWISNEPERTASIERLEKKYAMKNMGLPPLRHTQSAPGLERHGVPWSTLRSRRDPAHTMSPARVAAFEMTGQQVISHASRPRFSSGPADSMISYDVLGKNPGEPGYIAPSPFRASRVPERSMISLPDRKPPRTRESGGFPLSNARNEKVGCLGCFGL